MATVTPRFKAARTVSKRPGMSKAYLEVIRRLPSCVSGRPADHAHHLQMAPERGVGMKATDRWALPLTWAEHYNLHRVGSKLEAEWFANRGVSCYALAYALWGAWHKGGEELLRQEFEMQIKFPA